MPPFPRGPFSHLAQRRQESPGADNTRPLQPALQGRLLAEGAASNRLTAAYPPVLQFLRQAWERHPAPAVISLLDIGCGQGDLLRAVWAAARHAGREVALRGLDIDPASTREARRCTPPAMGIDYLTADLFEQAPADTDLIVCSQLAHRFDDAQIVALLQWLQRHARLGWCIADLRRHWLPWLGFRWLARAVGWHPLVRGDGTRSIARACTVLEWQRLLQAAAVAAEVQAHAPFRLTVQRFQRR